mgnify:CR=1 FL=1
MVRSKWLFTCLFFLALAASAQDRYMVFFTDKEGTPYSVDAPLEFLTQRALDRQAKEGYVLTEEDLPVNPAYVQSLREIEGVEVFFTSRWLNAVLVEMPASLEDEVMALPFVTGQPEFVALGNRLTYSKEPLIISETFTNPATLTYNTNAQVTMLGADELHADGHTGDGILVAVFDGGFSGVNLRAPFAALHQENRIIGTFDYVENSGNPYQFDDHGTQVLSCIAGKYASSFIGTAPDVSVILAVTEEVYKPNSSTPSEYRIEEYNWLFAAEMADSAGVDIINSSLGYSHSHTDPTMDYTYAQMDGQTTVVTKAANEAAARGMLVVNSAGNDGAPANPWQYISAPADSPEVLTVGSVTSTGAKSDFSSIGPTADGRIKPDVAAMGSLATTVDEDGNIVRSSGTSFSSPLIAGFAASLWQAFPELTRTELMDLIKSAGTLADNPDNALGWGIPNYLIIIEDPLGVNEAFQVAIYPNPASSILTIERNVTHEVSYRILDLKGQSILTGTLNPSEAQLSLEQIPTGIYFLHLQSGNFSETVKLLKK